MMKRIFAYAALALGAVVSCIPFFWMAVASARSTSDIFGTPPPLWPGTRLVENLARLENSIGFARVMLNSIGITVVYTALSSLISAMCGFGLAKYRFRGRKALFGAILATMMIPMQVLLVPLFQMMASMGWINTYQAVILPFLANAFGIFLMRQAFLGFPDELLDAARIDGLRDIRIFFRVVLPIARPQFAALVIYTFMFQWNAFIWQLVMLNSESMYTVPVALNTMIGLSHVDYSGLMLGSALATIPVLLIFIFFQKQFVAGLLGGSVKG